MNLLIVLIALAAGILVGLAAAWMFRKKAAVRYQEEQKLLKDELKTNIAASLLEALSKVSGELVKVNETERQAGARDLESKKALIDQQLQRMNGELDGVSDLIKELEKDRAAKFGELANQLKSAGEQSQRLIEITGTLKEALASSKVRGQWGERMAEDVLRLAGFIEEINYVKQKTIAGSGSRPDFTFLLPRNLRLNMDVKFPLDNYLRHLDAGNEPEKKKFLADFLRDVRAKIKEVSGREYIDPAQQTVDYVLLFIPNEQIYAFIHEHDHTLIDEGIKNRVIFCSPVTLFAVLAVIRQAVDNFSLEQTANEILSLYGNFKKQWLEFLKQLELLGKRIEGAHQEYEVLNGTRRRQLEKPLNKIEELRTQRGLPVAELPADEDSPALEDKENGSLA